MVQAFRRVREGSTQVIAVLARAMRSFLGRQAALAARDDRGSVADTLSNWAERRRYSAGTFLIGSIEEIGAAAELWARALRAKEYYAGRSDVGRDGARLRLEEVARADPELWADCLEDLLDVAPELNGIVEAITMDLANESVVNDRLRMLSSSGRSPRAQERAIGLLACIDGVRDPTQRTARTLLSFAAELVDGRPLFPAPLEARSSTWLSSTAVEQSLRDGIRRASSHFASYARDQGRGEEEGLTTVLCNELEVAFRNANNVVAALATKARATTPGLSLLRNVVPKSIETTWGCDLSLLLKVEIPGVALERAELVQVKKSSMFAAKPSVTNSWTIERTQLETLLRESQTASYWLIAGDGEVLIVPAIYLTAISRDFPATQGTVNVGYEQVRSAAIPLENYLVDLFLGLWVGGQSDALLSFARGERQNLRPRNIVEVRVSYVTADQK